MNQKNPHAVAIGSLAKGHKKTMTHAAIQQRRNATKARLKAWAKAKKASK